MDNRQPTPGKEGRVLITPEDGSTPFYARMTMADEPLVEGTPFAKETMLTDDTCDLLDLTYDKVVNDALSVLALPAGKYAVKVTVLTPGGKPFPGVTVSGITTRSGTAAVTRGDGTVLGFTTNQNVTLTVKNLWLDIAADVSKTQQLIAGVVNFATLQFERVSEPYKTFNSSTTVRLSPDVVSFGASAVGGGANGSSAPKDAFSEYAGSGGNGGQVKNMSDLQNDGSDINVIVGSVNATSSVSFRDQVITAGGGKGAYGGIGAQYAWDPTGNGGNGEYVVSRNSSNGGDAELFIHPPTEVGGGGGGGGCHAWDGQRTGNKARDYGGSGGNFGGGSGGYASSTGSDGSGDNGTLPGSGGGGGARAQGPGSDYKGYDGGEGQPGLCGLEWRYVDA